MAKKQCCQKPYIIEDTVFHKYGSSEEQAPVDDPENLETEDDKNLLTQDGKNLKTE